MFSWIGRCLIVLFVIFFYVSKTYSDDKLIPLVEYLYGDKAYPVKYTSRVPAKFIGENFLRGISRFAIPIGIGYLLYDFYKQYQVWTDFLNREIKTIEYKGKVKGYGCSLDTAKPFEYDLQCGFDVGSGYGFTEIQCGIKCYTNNGPPYCALVCAQMGPRSYADHVYVCYMYSSCWTGAVKQAYLKLDDFVYYYNNNRVSVIPYPSDPTQSAVEQTSNVTLARPVEDIVSDVDKAEPFSNTSPQLVDKIDPTTTTIIPDEYVNRDILPVKNENMTTNATRQWNETTTISNTTSNETGNFTNTTETTTGSEDLSFQYEKPGPGFIRDLLNFFKNIRLPIPSISGFGQCSFTIQVPFGKMGVLDYCQYHSLFQVIGNILVAMSGFVSIYILYKNS
ncbi:MAG: hypothetical protein ACPL1B_10055 [Thermoprotei archaeon]